jgi:hypothetical protein
MAAQAGMAGMGDMGDMRDMAESPARSRRPRERKLADVTVVASDGPIAAEVVDRRRHDDVRDADDELDDDDKDEDEDGLDDDDDELELRPAARKHEPARRPKPARVEPRRARPAPAREWDDDEETDSMVAAPVAHSNPSDRNTMIFGGIAAVAVIGLLWVLFDKNRDATPAAPEQPVLAQQQQLPPQPAPAPAPPPIDPNTGLPYGQVPAPIAAVPEPAAPMGSARTGSGRSSGVRGSSTPTSTPATAPAGGGVNPFADYKTPADPAGMGPAPQPQPAPAPANGTPAGQPPAPAPDGSAPAPAPAPTPAPAPEPAKPEEMTLPVSQMTDAQRSVVVTKVGDLQACYQDAIVGKPDLAGAVKFMIELDADGVVTKVDIAKDEIGYGVAKCAAKKIKRWTLPSGGLPMRFALPFDFKS